MIATHRRPTRGGAILGGLLLALLGTVALTNAQADRRGPAGGADANLAPQPKPWVRSLQGSGSNPDDAKIAAAMGKRLAEARFDKIELKAVIDWFRQVTEVNLVVDWAALEAAGIQATAPVKHIDLKNVPAGRALQAVLDDAGGSSTRLTFTIDDGVLLVSTPEALAGYDKRATKVYDVRAILAGRPVSEGEGADYTQAVAELIRTIQDQVDPTSWRGDAGGDIGQISVNYGQLVVTQTLQNHRRMEALLESLLEARVPKWKRDIHERLQKPIPKVDLAGVEFAAALDFIRQQTGLNIVVAPGAYTSAPVLPPGPAGPVGMPGGTMGRAMAPDGSVGVPGAMTGAAVAGPPPITLKVQNLTAQQVLSLIVRMAGMRWDLVDGAVYVSASAPVGVGPALPPDMLAPPVMPGASPYGPSYR